MLIIQTGFMANDIRDQGCSPQINFRAEFLAHKMKNKRVTWTLAGPFAWFELVRAKWTWWIVVRDLTGQQHMVNFQPIYGKQFMEITNQTWSMAFAKRTPKPSKIPLPSFASRRTNKIRLLERCLTRKWMRTFNTRLYTSNSSNACWIYLQKFGTCHLVFAVCVHVLDKAQCKKKIGVGGQPVWMGTHVSGTIENGKWKHDNSKAEMVVTLTWRWPARWLAGLLWVTLPSFSNKQIAKSALYTTQWLTSTVISNRQLLCSRNWFLVRSRCTGVPIHPTFVALHVLRSAFATVVFWNCKEFSVEENRAVAVHPFSLQKLFFLYNMSYNSRKNKNHEIQTQCFSKNYPWNIHCLRLYFCKLCGAPRQSRQPKPHMRRNISNVWSQRHGQVQTFWSREKFLRFFASDTRQSYRG